MSDGRTVWWAKDAVWYDREANVILRAEFGAEGLVAMDVLACMAKLENNSGRVKTGYHAITQKGGISNPETTRRIVSRAVELGALDCFKPNGRTFTARISGWRADQERGYAAWRKARWREQNQKAGQRGTSGTKRDKA